MEREADQRLVEYIDRQLHHWRDAAAAVVPRVSVSHEGWTPALNICHANVTQWVELNPEHRPVRGWLLFDQRPVERLGLAPYIELVAHSVVENETGVLLDITPVILLAGGRGEYPFCRHAGSEEEFEALINDYNLGQIRLYGRAEVERITYMGPQIAV